MAPGAGAVIALAHDVIITLGVLSLFHIEIDLTIVASLMSVIGYSLNDSIVVLTVFVRTSARSAAVRLTKS